MKILWSALLHRATIINLLERKMFCQTYTARKALECQGQRSRSPLHAADGTILLHSRGDGSAKTRFYPCDLDLGPLTFVPRAFTFGLWPWHSNSSEPGTTKHVIPVNLAQIRSAVPEIFDFQTEKNEKLELKMFNQTYTARKAPNVKVKGQRLRSPLHAANGTIVSLPGVMGAPNRVFVPGDLDLWPLTLTFKFLRARDKARPSCEFGANPFSGSRYIWCTNKKWMKKVTDSAKKEHYLRVIIK